MPTSTYVPSLPNQGSLEQDITCQDNEHRKPKKGITIPLWKCKHKKVIHPSANALTNFSLETFDDIPMHILD
jgi:hypothetical protein